MLKCARNLICLNILIFQVRSFSVFENITRTKRQNGNCGDDLPFSIPSFSCPSGECISGEKECDGIVDCKDGSDETTDCKSIQCAKNMFGCSYGACIKKDFICDGDNDCKDGSDERDCPNTHCSEFRCNSGQCINRSLKCDGKADCDDNSDEITATCGTNVCGIDNYRCRYGACVNNRAKCNGIVDCFDGSDEDPSMCKPATPVDQTPSGQASNGKCILPKHPDFGHWVVHGFAKDTFTPDQIVDIGTLIRIECNDGYILDGTNALSCDKGRWSAKIARCQKKCPSRFSTPKMQVTCIYRNTEVENCTEAVDGTLVRLTCASFHESEGRKRMETHLCQNGAWSQREPQCAPICGQKTVEATELIVNGVKVTKGDYPWQVALYRVKDLDLICGGTLISQRVIITAAHCVSDEKGKLLPKEDYKVAVGKYFRKFNERRDRKNAQFSEIQDMFVPREYKGDTQNYLGDISIIITEKTFVLSRSVQPVCLSSDPNFQIPPNEYGFVTGWGLTREHSKPSQVLKELKVPPVSESQCEANLPEDYEVYLTSDKLCAGYLKRGTSICRGDSGGGLVFKQDGRYYINAVVSLAPNSPTAEGGCDSQQYTLYTKIANYISYFILPKVTMYKT